MKVHHARMRMTTLKVTLRVRELQFVPRDSRYSTNVAELAASSSIHRFPDAHEPRVRFHATPRGFEESTAMRDTLSLHRTICKTPSVKCERIPLNLGIEKALSTYKGRFPRAPTVLKWEREQAESNIRKVVSFARKN